MENKKRLVVLTGAGMSAESGLAVFRGSNGLWSGYRIEDVATPEGWIRNPQQVLDFYNARRRELLTVKPNDGHKGLAALETDFDVRRQPPHHTFARRIDESQVVPIRKPHLRRIS